MCNDQELDDQLAHLRQTGGFLSRRQFAALSAGAAVASTLPRAAGAVDTKEQMVVVKTKDGDAEAYFVHPSSGKHPGIVFCADGMGLRQAIMDIAKRQAEMGYAVVIVNPYHRVYKMPAPPPEIKGAELTKLAQTITNQPQIVDGVGALDFLDKQKVVDTKRKAAVMGYCMGGPAAFRLAYSRPDRIAAVGSFHGSTSFKEGRLVCDQEWSPHLHLKDSKARYLVAIANSDDAERPTEKDTLREAFTKAKLTADMEVFNARHGWCVKGSPIYDENEAERTWGRWQATLVAANI